jgi:transposase
LSTKIHALVDALGNPLAFLLSAGQAHDLVGADALLPQMAADRLIADKAFDADARVREPLARAGKSAVKSRRDQTDLHLPILTATSTRNAIWSKTSSVNSNPTSAVWI